LYRRVRVVTSALCRVAARVARARGVGRSFCVRCAVGTPAARATHLAASPPLLPCTLAPAPTRHTRVLCTRLPFSDRAVFRWDGAYQAFAEDVAASLRAGVCAKLRYLGVGHVDDGHVFGQPLSHARGAARARSHLFDETDDTVLLEVLRPTAALWWSARTRTAASAEAASARRRWATDNARACASWREDERGRGADEVCALGAAAVAERPQHVRKAKVGRQTNAAMVPAD
jgi:hypothetical protein